MGSSPQSIHAHGLKDQVIFLKLIHIHHIPEYMDICKLFPWTYLGIVLDLLMNFAP